MSTHIHKSHNVTILLYHFVFPTKYRRVVIDKAVDIEIKDIFLEIGKRYEIHFVEIGTDKDHVHFLIQSVPMYSITKLVSMIKSITAKQMFLIRPQLKQEMWGPHLWMSGYYASTVGKHGNETVIMKYVKEPGCQGEYQQIHKNQLTLF